MHKNGGTFHWKKLAKCHSNCAMDVYNSIINKKHAYIDNTNINAENRSLYKLICEYLGCELIIITILPKLLLISDEVEELIKTLVLRSKKRQHETGQTLGLSPENVIRTMIERARYEFSSINCSKEEQIQTWLDWFPLPKRKHGLSIERDNTILARTTKIIEIFNNNKNIATEEELLIMNIKRGHGEHHVTLVGPSDFVKLSNEVSSNLIGDINKHKDLLEYVDPVPVKIHSSINNGNKLIYLILDWEWGRLVRKNWGLEPKEFRLTIKE